MQPESNNNRSLEAGIKAEAAYRLAEAKAGPLEVIDCSSAGVARVWSARGRVKIVLSLWPERHVEAVLSCDTETATRILNEIRSASGIWPERPDPDAGSEGSSNEMSAQKPNGSASGGGNNATKTRRNIQTRLVEAIHHGDEVRLLWDGERAYAAFGSDGHRECHTIRSKGFANWLRMLAYGLSKSIPSGTALKEAMDTLEGIAQAEGERATPAVRVAGDRNAIFIDLGDDEWRCVRVTKDGWSVESHPERGPYLWRPSNLAALPVPVRGGSIEELRPFLNLATEGEFRLVVAFTLMCLRPRGPYPALVFLGGQGSGKTYNSKAVKAWTDPSRVADDAASVTNLQKLPRDEDSLGVIAYHSRLLSMDNVSWLPEWASDELCRISTGETNQKRALYTDFDAVSITVCRPVLLNGIVNFVTRGDLADRAIVIHVPTLPERVEEERFWQRFRGRWPEMMGAIFDALQETLSAYDNAVVSDLPRMADFARWGAATERGLGWPEGSFMEAYRANISGAVRETLENDVIAEKILELMQDGGRLAQTPGKLLDALTLSATNATTNRRDWPQTGRALANRLERLKPLLAQEGIMIRRDPRYERRLLIEKVGSEKRPRYELGLTRQGDLVSRPVDDDE